MDQKQEDNIIIPGRIPPKDICFVNALMDDFDGMVVLRTVDAAEGRIEYWVAPGLIDEFRQLIQDLRDNMDIALEIDDPIPTTSEFHS